MNKKTLTVTVIILAVLLLAEILFLCLVPASAFVEETPTEPSETTVETTAETTRETTEETTVETTEETTEETTGETTEATEPEISSYVLTFVGDCTLGSSPNTFAASGSFVYTIGEDYEYPFRNVAEYFRNDDFTMINLESVMADSGTGANKTFTFRGPTAYSQILTLGSVEAVTLANNHTQDFGTAGYQTTKDTLDDAGITYVEKDGSAVFTTESGLTIGLYAASFDRYDADMKSEIASLKSQGAEIIVAAMHWGTEGSYRPTDAQKNWAHALVDAGVDIVYGHHPHVLQPMEEYKDGLIFYSLGNFSFGGNTFPRDMDSAIMQVEILRNDDGSVSLGELTIIPVSISSMSGQNNFQPTPYKEGSAEYERTLTKLDGTFTGPDLVVDYSFLDPTETTEATDPEETDAADTTPTESAPADTNPVETTAPADPAPTDLAPVETTAPPAETAPPSGEE